jgi:hypothetical protein
MYLKLVAGDDIFDLNPKSNPNSQKLTYNTPKFYYNISVFQYMAKGDSLSIQMPDAHIGNIGEVYLNDILCATKKHVSLDFSEVKIAVPNGLTEGPMKLKVYSNCGVLLDQDTPFGGIADNLYYTTTQFRFIPRLIKADRGGVLIYYLYITVSDTDKYTQNYSFQLKNKTTNVVTNLPVSTSYSSTDGIYYRTYNYEFKPSDYSGQYEVIVGDGTKYTCPTSAIVDFN